LDQATEQFKTAELQASQLQAELNQRPTRDDLNSAQSLADDLRSRLGQAREQLRASELRANQLQAEVNQRPTRDELNSAQRLADELRSQLDQASEQLRASQVRISEQEKELQAHNRAAQLTLIGRGDALLSSGDITSARLFYERAAEAGNAEAALRLGEMYDPAFLRRSRFQAKADSSRASFWYGRARELGSTEAEILLNGLQPR
jgi:TPR repeat protein